MIQKPASTPIIDRFKALLSERQDELIRELDEDDADDDDDVDNNVVSGDDIVRIYEVVLGELTFNSKPIITELTIIAGEQREFANGIAHVICSRIVEVAVDQKLPSLYLLDSIVKNIAGEYIRYFSSRLPEVFIEAYRQVQPNQHPAMRHLFGTWAAVFPSPVLRKIGVELQFPSTVNSQLSGSTLRSSASPSPRPTHGIHVNPKYLEARRQYEHASVMNEVHDSRGISSSLQKFRQNSGIGHGEYDMDDPDINSQQVGISRLGSPGIGAHASIPGAQRSIAPNYAHLRPSSPSRVRFPEPSPAPDDGYIVDNSPSRAIERASPSHCGIDHPTGRLNHKNGEWNDRWKKHPVNNTNTLSGAKLKSDFDRQGTRALIDAYGNYRGERISNGKPRNIDVNGIDKTTKKWQNSEEEEYVWEDMSPTPADRSRGNDLMPSHHSLQNNKRAGFDRRLITSIMDPDYRAGYFPTQPQLPVVDGTSGFPDMGLSIMRSGHRDTGSKCMGDPGDRNSATQIQVTRYSREPWSVHPHFSQSSQQHREVGVRADQVSFASSVIAPSAGQRNSSMMENAEVFSSKSPTSLGEKHFGQRPPSPPMASQRWSQVNGLPLPTHPQQNRIKDQSDMLVSHRPQINQGANEASNILQPPFDSFEKRVGNALLQLPKQMPGLTYLNNQSQGLVAPLPPQMLRSVAQGNYPAQNPTLLLPHPFNRGHSIQGHGTVPSALPLNRLLGVPPPPMYNIPNNSFQNTGGTRPPLPPGPPPPFQMGPSQSVVPAVSQPPYNDLISSLMAQGMIKMTPPVSAQDSIGIEFNVDILKVRHESAIKALYADLPRQCKTCGLRFKQQEEHSAHMDWHVTRNRVSRNRKQKPPRKWFVSTSLWLSGAENVGTEAIPGFLPSASVVEKKDDEVIAVPADENQSTCALCGEPFDDFYSDEAEEWMYRGAVYLDAPEGSTEGMDRSQLGPIVHAKCRSESTVGPSDDCGRNVGGRTDEDGNQLKRIRV